MKRLLFAITALLLALTQHVHAQYYSVNYDARTVAAMAAAFGTEAVAEGYYNAGRGYTKTLQCRRGGYGRDIRL